MSVSLLLSCFSFVAAEEKLTGSQQELGFDPEVQTELAVVAQEKKVNPDVSVGRRRVYEIQMENAIRERIRAVNSTQKSKGISQIPTPKKQTPPPDIEAIWNALEASIEFDD